MRASGGRSVFPDIWSRSRVALIVGACLLTGACGTWPLSRTDTSPEAGIPRERLAPIPASATEISEGLWMVPVDTDPSGCPRFRMMSNAKAVLAGAFYRMPSGDFTTQRGLAACAAV